tara:strand:+ start:172 stop:351 length:180 start_codon:yes stop_codon:yes gene_type:complete
MTISRAQMNKQIQNSTKIKKFNAGGLVSYNGKTIKPGSRSGNIGCGAIAPGKRKFTKIG